jgi:hypothetical protein
MGYRAACKVSYYSRIPRGGRTETWPTLIGGSRRRDKLLRASHPLLVHWAGMLQWGCVVGQVAIREASVELPLGASGHADDLQPFIGMVGIEQGARPAAVGSDVQAVEFGDGSDLAQGAGPRLRTTAGGPPNATYFSQDCESDRNCGPSGPRGSAWTRSRDNDINILQRARRPTRASAAVQGDRPTIKADVRQRDK